MQKQSVWLLAGGGTKDLCLADILTCQMQAHALSLIMAAFQFYCACWVAGTPKLNRAINVNVISYILSTMTKVCAIWIISGISSNCFWSVILRCRLQTGVTWPRESQYVCGEIRFCRANRLSHSYLWVFWESVIHPDMHFWTVRRRLKRFKKESKLRIKPAYFLLWLNMNYIITWVQSALKRNHDCLVTVEMFAKITLCLEFQYSCCVRKSFLHASLTSTYNEFGVCLQNNLMEPAVKLPRWKLCG